MKLKYAFAGASLRGVDMFISPMANQFADYCDMVGIYDINIGRARAVGEKFGIKVFDNFEEMINATKPDRVIVTTVDAFHSDYIIKSLEMGCDVVTEKPMTIDADRCNKILEAEKRTGKKVIVTFNYRYAPFMTQIKQLIKDGVIGDVFSVHFEWLLDRNMEVKAHGTSYFRRWNARMKNSGGLLVHKSTHHFDLVNWWLNDTPKTVSAFAKLNLYGAGGSKKYAGGIKGENCRNCEYADRCKFKYDITDKEKWLYADNEKYDGYYKDGCIYADDIDIYDTMSVLVEYNGGTLMSYSLNATCMYEGWKIAFNGSKGRIEAFLPESGPDSEADFDIIRVYDLDNNVKEYKTPKSSSDTHNGGDERLQRNVFVGDLPDPLGLCAGTRDGAYSIIVGAAANISIKERRPVEISDLLDMKNL
ncbi:MAG: Gfo/Idh/MocA family oxidoreductase [Clostridia bacterium]|nr:Gfo/Idh/MocA family oxidoreductase [Clostridia bacterium]